MLSIQSTNRSGTVNPSSCVDLMMNAIRSARLTVKKPCCKLCVNPSSFEPCSYPPWTFQYFASLQALTSPSGFLQPMGCSWDICEWHLATTRMPSRVARDMRVVCTGPVTASMKHCGTINDIFLSCAVPLLADRYPQTMQFLVLRPLLHSGPHHTKYYNPFLSKLSWLVARFKLRRGFSPRTVKTSGNGLTRLPYWFALHQMLNFNVLCYSEVRKLHLNIQYKSRIGTSVKWIQV